MLKSTVLINGCFIIYLPSRHFHKKIAGGQALLFKRLYRSLSQWPEVQSFLIMDALST